MEYVTWFVFFMGVFAVALTSMTSNESIAMTVKKPFPIAIVTNILCVVFIVLRSNYVGLNRSSLIATLEHNICAGKSVFKKYGLLLIGYVNLLFWGGWLICGMLLIIFFGGK